MKPTKRRFNPSTVFGNRGRSLETVIIASQRDIIRVDKMSAGAKWIKGGPIATRGPVDFIGEVVASGRAIHFDAKQTGEARGFEMSLLKAHQYEHLHRHGRANAIVGVLAECTAADVAAFFWIPQSVLSVAVMSGVRLVSWDSPSVTRLGGNLYLIPFGSVPEVAGELERVGA